MRRLHHQAWQRDWTFRRLDRETRFPVPITVETVLWVVPCLAIINVLLPALPVIGLPFQAAGLPVRILGSLAAAYALGTIQREGRTVGRWLIHHAVWIARRGPRSPEGRVGRVTRERIKIKERR